MCRPCRGVRAMSGGPPCAPSVEAIEAPMDQRDDDSAPGADTHRPHRPIEPSPAVVAATNLIPKGKVKTAQNPPKTNTRNKTYPEARPTAPTAAGWTSLVPSGSPVFGHTAHPARRNETRGASCGGLPRAQGFVEASVASHRSERDAAPRGGSQDGCRASRRGRRAPRAEEV